MTRSLGTYVAMLGIAALALSGCTSKPQVQATQSATERQLVLAHSPDATSTAIATLYQQMLESVGVKAKLGEPTPTPVTEVLGGNADIVVTGSSNLLTELEKTTENQHADPSGSPTPTTGVEAPLNADQTLKALHSLHLGEFALLDPAAAQRTGVLVTTASTSAAKDIGALAQLPQHCPELVFGIPDTLSAGVIAEFEATYSCTPARVLPIAAKDDAPVQALITNQVQVLATTADIAAISDNGLVVVQDSQSLFTPQTLLPLITTKELGQDAIDAINKVSSALKQEDLIALNRVVTGRDALPVDTAAADWLAERNLIKRR